MKLPKNKESGQILVWALILLAIGPLLIVPMLQLSSNIQKYNQMTEIYTLNTYAADSGIEYAKYQIYNNPSDIQETPLNENLVINGIDVYVTAEYNFGAAAYDITSTAEKAGRSLTIDCTIVIDVGLFGNVVACDGDLTITQCDFVSDLQGEADIYTNGDIDLFQSTVDGDVKASGVVRNHSSTVTGEIIEGAEALEFPPIDAELHEEKAKLGGTSGSISWNKQSTKNLGPLYIQGDLNVMKTDIVLHGTVYVTGNVYIDQSNISGFGDILCEGGVGFNMDHYSYTIGDSPILPLIMAINGGVDLTHDEGDGTYGILYAPQGLINLDHVEVTGSVAAPAVNLVQARINYPAEMRGRADLPGAGLDIVTYLFE